MLHYAFLTIAPLGAVRSGLISYDTPTHFGDADTENTILHRLHDHQWPDTVGAGYWGFDEVFHRDIPVDRPMFLPRYWLGMTELSPVWDLWDRGEGWLKGHILMDRDHDLWPWAYDPDADRMIWDRGWSVEDLPRLPPMPPAR